MNFFTKEVKIALVAIVGLVVLFYGLNFLKGLSIFSSEKISLCIICNSQFVIFIIVLERTPPLIHSEGTP